jgi:hypothetical protein
MAEPSLAATDQGLASGPAAHDQRCDAPAISRTRVLSDATSAAVIRPGQYR